MSFSYVHIRLTLGVSVKNFEKPATFFRCCPKEHRKVEEQNTKIQSLQQSLDELKKAVQELAQKK
jgi:hypothetical protein